METTNKLDLSQFTGTEAYYMTNRIFAPNMVHTDGVQYFAETAGCYWFLDIVATEYFPLLKKEPMLSIYLMVHDGKATITVQDGDLNELKRKSIGYTDCPDGEYAFYLIDNVLMLTSEY